VVYYIPLASLYLQLLHAFYVSDLFMQFSICSAHQFALSAVSFCSAMDVESDDLCANTHLSLPELTNYH